MWCVRNFHHVVTKFGYFFRFSQKSRMSNSTEIRPIGTALIQADRLTDRRKKVTIKSALICMWCVRNFHHVVTKFGYFFRFSQKSRISNSKEIRPVGTALTQADRLTDRRKKVTIKSALICVWCVRNFHHVVTKFGFFFRFSQKSRMSNSTEIRPVGTALI